MNYQDYPDGELYMMVCEDNEDAKEILFQKYKYILNIVIKKYTYIAKQVGIDVKELYSDALLGFTDAIKDYKDDRKASFPTFLSLCIGRRLKKAIVHATTYKNKIMNESYSLDDVYNEKGIPLIELLSDQSQNDPLANMTQEEAYRELIEQIKTELSDFENQVFTLMINDFNYIEIAKLLAKSPKQIDNTMQRIKVKAKKVLTNERPV